MTFTPLSPLPGNTIVTVQVSSSCAGPVGECGQLVLQHFYHRNRNGYHRASGNDGDAAERSHRGWAECGGGADVL